MTLISTLLSNNVVLQISDRRVTWLQNGVAQNVDDRRNKAILYGSRFVVSYTGIANLAASCSHDAYNLEKSGTDLWLVEHLSRYDNIASAFNDMPRVLAQRCASGLFRGQSLGIRAAGWRHDGSNMSTGFVPFVIEVKNYDSAGRLHDQRGTRFVTASLSGGDGVWIGWLGRSVSVKLKARLTRTLRRILTKRASINAVIQSIVDTMRQAAKHDTLIGKDLLVCVLPRTAARPDGFEHLALFGRPREDAITFEYLPANSDLRVQYGPHYVSRGVALTNLKGGPL